MTWGRIHQVQIRYVPQSQALAQVRKLLGPNIQVNIAEKQINTLGAAPARG